VSSEGIDYLLAVLEFELKSGRQPLEALASAVASYAYVHLGLKQYGPPDEGNEAQGD
jgi:hypothetical protein